MTDPNDTQETGKVLQFPTKTGASAVSAGHGRGESPPPREQTLYVIRTRTGYWGARSIDAAPTPTQPEAFAWTYSQATEAKRIAFQAEQAGAEDVKVEELTP